jgi:hypothetical protein
MTRRFCERCKKEIPATWQYSEQEKRYELTVGLVRDLQRGGVSTGTATDIIIEKADLYVSCWRSVELVLFPRVAA